MKRLLDLLSTKKKVRSGKGYERDTFASKKYPLISTGEGLSRDSKNL